MAALPERRLPSPLRRRAVSQLRLWGLRVLAQGVALLVWLWAKSCRVRVYDDPRPELRRLGRPYVYALLHAQQIAAVLANDEPFMAAMVSRSQDGDVLVPSLRARRVLAVRGSSRRGTQDKGGTQALAELIALNKQGVPVLLAVDGPRGPRGHVHRGVVALAEATGAVILPVTVTATRARTLLSTWDHTQVPWPGTALQLRFAPGIEITGADDLAQAVQRVAAALQGLQRQT